MFWSFRDHCGNILGQLWQHFGIIVGSFWNHFGIIWDHFEIVLGSFWDLSGIILGSLWDHSGTILGSLWDHSGIILGSFVDHFEIILKSFWDHVGPIFDFCAPTGFSLHPYQVPNILLISRSHIATEISEFRERDKLICFSPGCTRRHNCRERDALFNLLPRLMN